MAYEYDATVVGSGPNGLAAAITLAKQGLKVLVMEGAATPGGGMRTQELTLPGFRHDVCSAVHPMGLASPFFQTLELERYGVEWVHPEVPLAHPLDGGEAVLLHRSLATTADGLGADARAYFKLLGTLVHKWSYIDREVLGPLSFPRRPFSLAWFGVRGLWPASAFLRRWFQDGRTRALLAGIAAHANVPLEYVPTTSIALIMAAIAHLHGWPMVRGGSQGLADAMVRLFTEELRGTVACGRWVKDFSDIPSSRLVFFDTSTQQLLQIMGTRLPWLYRKQLQAYRPGPGVFKVDYALDGPVPWANPEVARAGTVHLAGTLEEICVSERHAWKGRESTRPFVLVAQPSGFDASRAPEGKTVVWAYCHVPRGSTRDFAPLIEAQFERFAPGFSKRVLARSVLTPAQLEAYNPNYAGGDITGGALLPTQLFTRPVLRRNPYSTPLKGVYLCSASTPPGGGVHGMCGYHAALSAFREHFWW